ncbi:tRNA delta(2)-isopentenylpyrophosphate transferase [Haematobacter missouriensis]|uniref:tRNA dimethylallyltransferase n=1 Tax=Haematobacter missouriensis TaxID=366616 RepID=A0A212AY61_9RHOB|nr:tRNA (adenosine(37)-N6)-dimethylallyltransferase MiaA [Haematobacter missouriensis]KFI27250.1 tRNA delta(2)-isopentenylpyrophosphate transferase [Haematobacter missouriensis]OWJ77577.1 tRNA dimethylallyltransferase [Haematobacter missouriensis]OWJ86398.1 tRNA dimethylallyltransferase [Haematobacter missouriensis]
MNRNLQKIDIIEDKPILIAGCTASGKSALAIELAQNFGGVVVNADALQVYANWRILTARPSEAETAGIPHLLYGHVAREADYSVGHWLRDLAPLLRTGARPIIVGGTGLYLTALTEGLAEIPPTPGAVREEADGLPLERLITQLDPQTAAKIDLRNRARVQRAWEVLRATGRGLAAWQMETGAPLLPHGAATLLHVDADRDWLAERIDSRFDHMIDSGALEEARAELPHWDPARPSSRAIGAPELLAHLNGEMSLDAAKEQAKAATRQYAKRQRTWFRRRMGGWHRLPRP